MKSKKLLSLLLALIMMLSVVPFYASAEAVALTKENIVEYPTVSGEIYFTQKIGDYLTLVGGKVTTDGTAEGTVVPGHFEFIDPEFVPTSDGENSADFKFIPDDADAYTGFEVDTGYDVRYTVNEATMKFADPTAVPTATDVEAGKRLTKSDIIGVDMVCQLTGATLTNAKWTWEKSSTKVEASGYFPAKITCIGYETINNVFVYVRIAGDTSAPPIEEFPTIDPVVYKDGLTAKDLEIKGGKANIPGSFAFADPDQALKGGTNAVTVVFTPEDTSIAPINITINVTVEKIPSTFIDENGNAIVPVVTVPFGFTNDSVYFKNALANYQTNCGEFTYHIFSNYRSTAGEYDVIAKIIPKSSNYSGELKFKLIVEPIKIVSVKYYGNARSMHITLSYKKAPGTFDVYVDGALVGSALKLNEFDGLLESSYNAEVSGTHKIKVVYNKADESDTCVVDESEVEFTANAKRELTTEGLTSTLKANGTNVISTTHIYYGDEISLECTMKDLFTGWEITDTEGNPVELEILTKVTHVNENGSVTFENVAGDLSCENIIFTMPDYDIIVKAKSTLDEEETPDDGGDDTTGDDTTGDDTDDGNGGLDIDNIFGDLTEGNSDNAILNIFNNIIAWFKNIIETIKGFFRAIGDAT